MAKFRRRRTPKLRYTESQQIGWHTNFRDPETGKTRRKRFGMIAKHEAEVFYHEWLSEHLRRKTPTIAKPNGTVGRRTAPNHPKKITPTVKVKTEILRGSVLDVTTNYLQIEESRTRSTRGEGKAKGTIHPKVLAGKKKAVRDFVAYLNEVHGQGSMARRKISDLTMADIEGFNRWAVDAGFSESQVRKRMQVVRAVIDRAGRPEFGEQRLSWNWTSRDVVHGRPTETRTLPTLHQLMKILNVCDVRETAIVWTAIGCGFGQGDLASLHFEHIDQKSFDLRRGKTAVERYGETPRMVWRAIENYLETTARKRGQP